MRIILQILLEDILGKDVEKEFVSMCFRYIQKRVPKRIFLHMKEYEDDIYITGSILVKFLNHDTWNIGDIDIFCYEEKTYTLLVDDLKNIFTIDVLQRGSYVYLSRAINMEIKWSYIDVVQSKFPDITRYFDINICKSYIYKGKLYTTREILEGLRHREFIYDVRNMIRRKVRGTILEYPYRIKKYESRGYKFAYVGFEGIYLSNPNENLKKYETLMRKIYNKHLHRVISERLNNCITYITYKGKIMYTYDFFYDYVVGKMKFLQMCGKNVRHIGDILRKVRYQRDLTLEEFYVAI